MKKYNIVVQHFHDDDLPKNSFMAYITDPEYKGIVVTASSFPEVLSELAVSVLVKLNHDVFEKKE